MSVLGLQLHTALFYVHVPLSRIKYVLHTISFKSSICTACKMVSQLTARNASYLCERKALPHNITLSHKKQVHTYIDWFLPLQKYERRILMVRKIVLLFCNLGIIFDCRSTQPWFNSCLQIQKKETYFSLEFFVHICSISKYDKV